MPHVLSLVTAPGALSPHLCAAARSALREAGADIAAGAWLADGEAWEAVFAGLGAREAEATVRSALAGAPVDVAVTAAAGRRKRLLCADMDSTIIGQECIDMLAARAGASAAVADLTRRAMAGELNFEDTLRRRVALLAGAPEELLQRTLDDDIRLSPGARTLVATMKAHGAATALLSGGFRFFTERVAAWAGFDACNGNRLEMENGRLTGRLLEPVEGADAKRQMLERMAADRGVAAADILAVGDGANDVPMLRAAGLGVAFRARPSARAAAGARIDRGGLTALLYLQGYRRAEFALADSDRPPPPSVRASQALGPPSAGGRRVGA